MIQRRRRPTRRSFPAPALALGLGPTRGSSSENLQKPVDSPNHHSVRAPRRRQREPALGPEPQPELSPRRDAEPEPEPNRGGASLGHWLAAAWYAPARLALERRGGHRGGTDSERWLAGWQPWRALERRGGHHGGTDSERWPAGGWWHGREPALGRSCRHGWARLERRPDGWQRPAPETEMESCARLGGAD
nr:unnamed protein product [Digitaria exilis]